MVQGAAISISLDQSHSIEIAEPVLSEVEDLTPRDDIQSIHPENRYG